MEFDANKKGTDNEEEFKIVVNVVESKENTNS